MKAMRTSPPDVLRTGAVTLAAWAEGKVSAFVLQHCHLEAEEYSRLAAGRYQEFEAAYQDRAAAEGRPLDDFDRAKLYAVRLALGSLYSRIGGQTGRA